MEAAVRAVPVPTLPLYQRHLHPSRRPVQHREVIRLESGEYILPEEALRLVESFRPTEDQRARIDARYLACDIQGDLELIREVGGVGLGVAKLIHSARYDRLRADQTRRRLRLHPKGILAGRVRLTGRRVYVSSRNSGTFEAPPMRLPRVGFTMRRMMVAVAIVGTAMGLVARLAQLARDPVMTPARFSMSSCAPPWGTAIGFSLVWLFKRVASAIAHRKCRKV